MQVLRSIAILFLTVAFLGAGMVAVWPKVTRDQAAHRTMGLPRVEPGIYQAIERPDLRPSPAENVQYSSPAIAGAEARTTFAGFVPRRWHLFAPTASADTVNPVVILFHGAGRDSLSMIDQWQEVATEEGLILIGLNAPRGGWRPDAPDGVFLHDVLDRVDMTLPVDRDRVFLYGHSAGSVMAQVVANRVIGPWRGVATHAGTVNPGLLHRIENAPPVRHYLGTSDGIFDPATARRVGALAAEAGHEHTLVLIPGHTHWYYEGGPAFAAEAWVWFDSLSGDVSRAP